MTDAERELLARVVGEERTAWQRAARGLGDAAVMMLNAYVPNVETTEEQAAARKATQTALAELLLVEAHKTEVGHG